MIYGSSLIKNQRDCTFADSLVFFTNSPFYLGNIILS